MAIIRWQPFTEMQTLHRQMNQIFDEMLTQKRDAITWKPAAELEDTDNNLILRLSIPGVEAKDLNIRVTQQVVAISGEKRQENQTENNGSFRSEFRYGKFQRVIPLPVAIENNKVQAEFKDGILTLTLPKVIEARNQVVKINLADNTAQTAPEANQTDEAKAA
ncbi:Hsp20/alpha crystallin family protein [Tolypothrix sp. VBCCA 56010]|uniref:Hsp20/alpha crystallin family protein n=1 Tax=Tolypothrix sp. VBCCA 56010 TaxID=3137731 RepID=UPI003D7D01FA